MPAMLLKQQRRGCGSGGHGCGSGGGGGGAGQRGVREEGGSALLKTRTHHREWWEKYTIYII